MHRNQNFSKQKRLKQAKRRVIRRLIVLSLLLYGLHSSISFLRNSDSPHIIAQLKSLSFQAGEQTTPVTLSDSEETGTDKSAWNLILVNKWNPIPDDYQVKLTTLANGERVDRRIYPALKKMFDAARRDHIYPVVASGYRTTEKQQKLMEEKVDEYKSAGCSLAEATAKAKAWVAIPGTSEHQLGIAVDINADGIRSKGDEVYHWLNQNAYQFGFIRRYPPDKTEITGVINEPWHYRYVGVKAATEIQRQGTCLEEYLKQKEKVKQ